VRPGEFKLPLAAETQHCSDAFYHAAVEITAHAYGEPVRKVMGKPLWFMGALLVGIQRPTRKDLMRWADDGGPA
jgi:hypothetical protein